MRIRHETPSDAPTIARVVERAFANHPHSLGNEVLIIRNLRAAGALSVSLVADVEGQVRGFVAASPVLVEGGASGWYGLGPLAVDRTAQGEGIGLRLITECLNRLQRSGAAGCVVLGEPTYYGRFGFKAHTGLTYQGPPPEYFMAMSFGGIIPRGEVTYHAAFASEA